MTITPEARQAARKEFDDIQHSGVEPGIHIQRLLDSQAEKYRPIVEALESISEYWNLHADHEAMLDACHHNAETAQEALALARELMGGKE